jgi:hypothetical protein
MPYGLFVPDVPSEYLRALETAAPAVGVAELELASEFARASNAKRL